MTYDLNQGRDTTTQQIEAALQNIPNSNNLSPTSIRGNMCIVASLYVDLNLSGADVGTFAEFYAKEVNDGNILAHNSWTEPDDRDNIINSYSVNGNQLEKTKIDDYDTFIELMNSGEISHGTLRVNGTHTMNVYRHNGTNYVSDVGTTANDEKVIEEIVGDYRENFSYF